MRNGYYLYAYIEINEYANYYKTDTKRHDQNISLWKYSDGDLSLVRYWEFERLSRIKHHNKAFSTKEQFIAFINQLLSHFDLDDSKLVGIHAPPYFELIEDRNFMISDEYNYHSLCHLFSVLLMETELFYSNDILAFSVDLDADYITDEKSINKHDYVGCFSQKGNIRYLPVESPAPLWSIASHDMKLGEGTLMALASASPVRFVKKLDFSKERFFSNNDVFSKVYDRIKTLANECCECDIDATLQNYDETFSFEDNIRSAIMKEVQSISIDIMQRNVEKAINHYGINPVNTILAMSGGFALNCPANSFILRNNHFKGFVDPPCVNHSGQSLGMALYHFYSKEKKRLSFSLKNAYHGTAYNEKKALELYKPWIDSVQDYNVEKVVDDVMKDAIVWFDGCSEIGPRALGHRRLFASKRAGLTEVPALVVEMDRDNAAIALVDSNLHRDNISPSEKAFAYKLKMEAMSRQGYRSDLTSGQVVPKSDDNRISAEIGEAYGESYKTVQRYIRLTCLHPKLLEYVDEGRIAFTPAVELSYLNDIEQQDLIQTIESEDCTPSLSQAVRMKKLSQQGRLDDDKIGEIMAEEKANQKERIKIPTERVRKYFPKSFSNSQIEDAIVKMCEAQYRKKQGPER